MFSDCCSQASKGGGKMKRSGAICGNGMCPYVPCKDFPKCNHTKKQLKYKNQVTKK